MAAEGPIIVNPWHWLEPDGAFPDIARVRGNAIRVAQFIEYGGPLEDGEARPTLVTCRKRPGGSPCSGFMFVLKQADASILAFCAGCDHEEFRIYEWQDTPWAEGQALPTHVSELAALAGPPEAEPQSLPTPTRTPPTLEPHPLDEALARTLRLLGSPLSGADVRAAVANAPQPTEIVNWVVNSCPKPPGQAALQQFLPILIKLWNTTGRPELGGHAPDEAYGPPARAQKVGRNEPCPCGSGRKYKKCCLNRRDVH